ncbi:uncharacterized protein V6R79_019554 [Siganus canaliculatus]
MSALCWRRVETANSCRLKTLLEASRAEERLDTDQGSDPSGLRLIWIRSLADLYQDPPAGLDQDPSAGLDQDLSADLYQDPLADLDQDPSADLDQVSG